jgi:hypothetical protein
MEKSLDLVVAFVSDSTLVLFFHQEEFFQVRVTSFYLVIFILSLLVKQGKSNVYGYLSLHFLDTE